MATPSSTDYVDYEEQQDELITGEAVALDLRPAGFVLRATGAVIDFLAYMLAYVAGVWLLLFVILNLEVDEALARAILIGGLVFFTLLVPIAVEVLTHGRSLGKLAIGARIVRDDGGPITLRHAAIRATVGMLEVFMSVGSIAALVGLLNPRAKRLGDFVAGTYAQHERVPKLTTPVYGVPVQLTEWAKTADVARMPDALARRISHFLQQTGGLTPETRVRLGRQLANEASVYVSPLPAVDAELFLAAVAAMRRDREFAALQLEQRRLQRLTPVLRGLPHRFPQRRD
jgi:uncharacterized RDD family membrane protein YckC